ncbi:hypothetical protein [Rhodopila sp.]|uniref:hypothetical protein n=1 Tax=Rhodopila sp. TaxID=2480087 RepID=UPI003D0F469D
MNPPKLKTLAILTQSTVSPLYRWLWEEFDLIEVNRKRYGTDWQALAELANRYGIMAGRGKKPTANIVRQTFYRVRARRNRSVMGRFNRSVQAVTTSSLVE